MRALSTWDSPDPRARSDAGARLRGQRLCRRCRRRLPTTWSLPFTPPPVAVRRVERKFSDKEVCKAFLCGFCPHEEFRRTKNDCGDCTQLHDEACRKQWEELDDRTKERYG